LDYVEKAECAIGEEYGRMAVQIEGQHAFWHALGEACERISEYAPAPAVWFEFELHG